MGKSEGWLLGSPNDHPQLCTLLALSKRFPVNTNWKKKFEPDPTNNFITWWISPSGGLPYVGNRCTGKGTVPLEVKSNVHSIKDMGPSRIGGI